MKNTLSATTRRDLLRYASIALGGGLLAASTPKSLLAEPRSMGMQTAPAKMDRKAQMLAAGAKAKLTTTKLRDNLYMISGSGGNMAVVDGPDGKVLIDSSFATTAPHLKEALAAISSHPLKLLINTHWHFDHTSGNAAMHEYGAMILAHENTRKRLSTPQDMTMYGVHFDPSPAAALPQQTFKQDFELYFNNQHLLLSHYKPAHTDSDIYIHFPNSNVIHIADTWFNGFYPLIDYTSGGNIRGMVAAAERSLALVDAETRILPGHGPLGDKAALQNYHDMLATVQDRVQKLKASGKSIDEAVAAKPTSDLDAKWGGSSGDAFVKQVYLTL
ncbi:MAG: MBL fold metallo-hydrolase [Acidobacteriaceae bacterium]